MPRDIVKSYFLTNSKEAIKEALAIHLLVKYRAEFPMSTVTDWFPPELVSDKQEALNERLAFFDSSLK